MSLTKHLLKVEVTANQDRARNIRYNFKTPEIQRMAQGTEKVDNIICTMHC